MSNIQDRVAQYQALFAKYECVCKKFEEKKDEQNFLSMRELLFEKRKLQKKLFAAKSAITQILERSET